MTSDGDGDMDDHESSDVAADLDALRPRVRRPSLRTGFLALLALLLLLWIAPVISAALDSIDVEGVDRPYLLIFAFVAFDAVIPIFPSESLLTTASNLAAQEDSDLVLWSIALAGSLGAIVGDSMLYWLSRTVGRRYLGEKLEQAKQDQRVATALDVFGEAAPLLIVFGRFVPGLRFVVGATMGIGRYPYPRFLLWDAIGGTLWATYTCVFSYSVATVIEDNPVVSILISVVVTTAVLALLYFPLKRALERSRAKEAAVAQESDQETEPQETQEPGQESAQQEDTSS